MKLICCCFFCWCIFLFSCCILHAQPEHALTPDLHWDSLPVLPPVDGRPNIGVAGAFAGLHNGALIIAGGANFPGKKPWDGGKKVYHRTIYVLPAGSRTWKTDPDTSLPFPVAYGAAVSTPYGIVCAGGMNDSGYLSTVLLLHWEAADAALHITSLSSLPFPLANAAIAYADHTVYIAGGENDQGTRPVFLSLRLNMPKATWKSLPLWPGPARTHSLLVSQSNGETSCLYLIGGRKSGQAVGSAFNDAYAFNIAKQEWIRLPDISVEGYPYPLSAHCGGALGNSSIFIFGGDDGANFRKLQQLDTLRMQATSQAVKDSLAILIRQLQTDPPGFKNRILFFHTITRQWQLLGKLPFPPPATTTAIPVTSGFIIPCGEIRPGVRTPAVYQGTFVAKRYFGWINFAVIGLYIIGLLFVSARFTHRQKHTNDYFRGGQRIPGWAAGLSIFGANISAITFLAIPAKTYATNWSYFIFQMTILMVIPLITGYFIPVFRRLNVTSAYEFLEERFNVLTRVIGGLSFVLFQVGRCAIVILLPSIVLSLVTGFNVVACILVMGGFSILYTVLGGIEAVIWTEVIQVIILLGGALVCLALLPFMAHQPLKDLWHTTLSANKLHVLDFTFDWSTPTFWVVLLGGIGTNIINYGTEQTVIQRYLVTSDIRNALRGYKLGAWLSLPASLIFFSIGTLLYLFYTTHPAHINPVLENTDAIFPWFIITELPVGVAGLLIAAVLAASMSSLESSMNAVSSVITTDFVRRFGKALPEKAYLLYARLITLLVGVFSIGTAVYLSGKGIPSLWDQFNIIIGLVTGGVGGLFILGLFVKKANSAGALSGLGISILVQCWILFHTQLHLLLYAAVGIAVTVIAGWILSLLFRPCAYR